MFVVHRAKLFLTAMTLILAFGVMASAQEVTIRVSHRQGAHHAQYQGVAAVAEAFMSQHPNIRIEVEPGWNMQRLLVGTAGGAVPDIVYENNGATLAANGIVRSLESYVQRADVGPDDFAPGLWDGGVWNGSLYTLVLENATGILSFYSRARFAEAGLDPDAPPLTINQLDAMSSRLTRTESDGTISQVPIVPWYGLYSPFANITYWAGAFGAELWNIADDSSNLLSPPVIAALEWLTDQKARYPELTEEFTGGHAVGPWSRVVSGNTAIGLDVFSRIDHIRQEHPDFDLGIAMPLYHDDWTSAPPAHLAGWRVGISVHSQYPDEAWEFIYFLTSTVEGATLYADVSGGMPGYIHSPYFQEMARDREKRVMLDLIYNGQPMSNVNNSTFYGNTLAQQIIAPAVVDIIDSGAPIRGRLEQANEQALAFVREQLGM